jgi:vitamin B12 transporter
MLNIRTVYVIGDTLYEMTCQKNKVHNLRNIVQYFIVLLIPIPLFGQHSMSDDTIKIKEVVISRTKAVPDAAGFKKTLIDTTILTEFSNHSLSEMLTGTSTIFMKSYGMGGTATPSFRGTTASQTLIEWNGIKINNPMLGQSDLSLIPVGLIDDVQVYYGGASMVLNNGGIGGAINLENKPVWKKEFAATLNSGMGSFGEYTGFGKIKTGNAHFQSVTNAFFRTSENDFKYLNSESILQTRNNSQVTQKGLTQELYFKEGDNIASARIWYQTSDRHLPPALLSQDLIEKQFDESLRIMLDDNLTKGKNNYFFTGAFLSERLNYTSQVAKIDSKNLAETYIMKSGRESQLGDNTKMKITLEDELSTVKSNNYSHFQERNMTTLTAYLERACIGRLGLTVLLREILNKKTFLLPDFSTAIQLRIINYRDYYLKANFSRNSRIPTMNDLFWPYVGNPALKNEYSYTSELTYEMNQKVSSRLNIRSELTVYHNNIKDMILWHSEGNSLRVDNISLVKTKGFESSVSMSYSISKFSASLNAGYSFTKATNLATGKQLIYTPEHQVNSLLRIAYGNVYSSFDANYVGIRYLTADNSDYLSGSDYLPGYILNKITAGLKLPLHGTSIDINFNLENLFDINYQSIAQYPMPGRSYLLKVLFQFIKKS